MHTIKKKMSKLFDLIKLTVIWFKLCRLDKMLTSDVNIYTFSSTLF